MKIVLSLIIAFLICFILAGASTWLFVETSGEITKSSQSEVRGMPYTGYRVGVTAYEGDIRVISDVRYNYSVEEEQFSGSVVALWVLSSTKEAYWPGRNVSVFYAPFYPKFAVLKKGPDVLLLFAAIAFILLRFFLKKLLQEAAEDV